MARPESVLRPRPFDQILTGEYRDMAEHVTVRPRGTDDWLIIHTFAGAGIVADGGQRHEVTPGDILLSPPGTSHDYRTSQRAGHWALLWGPFRAARRMALTGCAGRNWLRTADGAGFTSLARLRKRYRIGSGRCTTTPANRRVSAVTASWP